MNAILDATDLNRAVANAILGLDAGVEGGLREAAELVEQSAKAEHGYTDRSGDLTRSIEAQPVTGAFYAHNQGADVSADAGHAKFVHGGTKPHVIRARKAKALAFKFGIGGGHPGITVFARSVNHPGTEPEPFLTEALERELDNAADRVFDGALDALRDAGFQIQRG